MKKIILSAFLLTALLGNISISAQDKIGLQKYDYVTNGDTNMYQGIPNIAFPLLHLSVPTSGINVNLSMSYTTESASGMSLISDVGKGWNLSGVGSIVRYRTHLEKDYYTEGADEAKSDVFAYNYPGGSGKFYIGMDKVSHVLTAVFTSPSNDKIIITPDSTRPNRVSSFTIIDTKGNRYLFDKLNINKMHLGEVNGETVMNTKLINSAFLLSKIFNVKNEETAAIEYETTTEVVSTAIGSIQQQKIKKITAHGIGSIEYLYRPNAAPHSLNSQNKRDWYVLEKVMLKDTGGKMINQYSFNNLSTYLRELINLDKNGNTVQKFSFEYNHEIYDDNSLDAFGYPNEYVSCQFDQGELRSPRSTNRNASSYGTLKRIILPTGGITEYEFEPNSIPVQQRVCQENICFYDNHDFDKIYTLNFDMNLSYVYTFSLPPGYQDKIFVKYTYDLHPTPPPKPGVSNEIEYTVNDYSGDPFMDCDIKTFANPSTLNVQFTGTRKGYGTLEIYAAKQQKKDENEYGYGLRVKSVKNFNPGSAIPLSHITYDYNSFSNPSVSSGVGFDYFSMEPSIFSEPERANGYIGYTQIKMTDMIGGNYSKYYYLPLEEIAPGIQPSFPSLDKDMGSYLRAAGMLKKKEDYSPTGQILQKTEMSYQFKDIPVANVINGTSPVKKINIFKQASTTEAYISGTAKKLVSTSESNFEDTYNNMVSSKETLSDGTVVEKSILYPAEKGVQKLLSANMVDIPLETSTKKNGDLVGKAETKFDDPSTVYPTSVVGYNRQTQSSFTASTMDVYDSKGNLVQVTGKNGIPSTTIWGYYQTKPIAVIGGTAYSQVASLATVTAAITASNADHDNPANEPALLQALEALRKDPALKNYSVTASTYDPMVGVTNSISANGIRTVNIYDNANRLMKVTDSEGKTLQETQYNYKH
ncbi:hypothetical protein HHL23_07120 [Chryseobacterium sp. RP-3-3]|uniref:YD repeat-containing protein n=1 Tax=Chryseobacterium antibioticum TaxID=2728847 RepID=A0A7Y0ALJ5_9FLAO|nr:hypothetical protein [Chryseobacterium antibioticum]NML69564.1 hypothetical protein [Chryseobacterium antibioticum]